MTTNNYRDAVLKAMNFGDDANTTATVCGDLARIYYGYDSIPEEWINTINKIDEMLSLCDKYKSVCDDS